MSNNLKTDINNGYVMNRPWGIITMILSATGMGLVPLFGRMATRANMFESQPLNAGNSVGALMATGRMAMGILFFVILVLVTGKWAQLKACKPSFAIIMGGLMIGLSLGCYVTSTLLTTVTNAILLIYTGPVFCVIFARIFRKESISLLGYICLVAVFIGMLFGNQLMGIKDGAFFVDFNLAASLPNFPSAGIGNIFGFLSGVFYGASMFFNGYRKDVDSAVRGVWNFISAAFAAGVLTIVLNYMGTSGIASQDWALNLHLSTFNWVSAIAFWIVCGPIALGLLLVAGRNLPAADYGIIAYWEVPVALFVGLIIFGESFNVNTLIGTVLIIAGGAVPALQTMLANKKSNKNS